MKRLYYRDNYGKYPEGYIIAVDNGTSYEVEKNAYIRANSRCKNGCCFMTDKPVYMTIKYGRVILKHD